MKKSLSFILIAMLSFAGCNKKNKEAQAPAPGSDMNAPMPPEPAMSADATPVPAEMAPEAAMSADATPTQDATPAAGNAPHLEVPPDAVVVETPIWHKTFTLEGKKYFLLDSSMIKETRDIKGYAAPLQIWAIFDESGTLARVKIASHKETPEFIERVEKEWLPKFSGLAKDKLILGAGGIDALSEATLSTDAIRKTVDALRALAFTQLLKLPIPQANPAPAKTGEIK